MVILAVLLGSVYVLWGIKACAWVGLSVVVLWIVSELLSD